MISSNTKRIVDCLVDNLKPQTPLSPRPKLSVKIRIKIMDPVSIKEIKWYLKRLNMNPFNVF